MKCQKRVFQRLLALMIGLSLLFSSYTVHAAEDAPTEQPAIIQEAESEYTEADTEVGALIVEEEEIATVSENGSSESEEPTAVIEEDEGENTQVAEPETEETTAPVIKAGVRALAAAAATAPTKWWIEPTDTNGIPSQIDAFKSGSVYQLYLPGSVDVSNCKLCWNNGATVTLNNMTYESGTCPVPSLNTEKTYVFNYGNTSLNMNFITYQGSPNVQPVFIVVDESDGKPTIAQMDADDKHNVECSGMIFIEGKWYNMPKMKGRGNATWEHTDDKKPYNVTLESKTTLGLDTPKTKKWSFLAEAYDHSLLCNRAGFYLAHQLGIAQDTLSADVWMNGEYQGCYTITPKTDSFVTDDGFMIEQDNYLEDPVSQGGDPQFKLDGLNETSGWTSAYNRITVKEIGDNLLKDSSGKVDNSPENKESVALNTIKPWLQDAWDAIRSTDGYNSKGKYYTDYIDIESFAKMYLMHEYVKSYDICAGSLLYYRDGMTESDKLKAGPLWDLDNALGSVCKNDRLGSQSDRSSAKGDFIVNVKEDNYKTSVYKTLGTHSDFMAEVKYQYTKYKAAFNNVESDVQSLIDQIELSAKMNHYKVKDLGNGQFINLHYYKTNTTLERFDSTYKQNYLATTNSKTDWANYAANLKTYMKVRSLWMKNHYVDPNYVDPANCSHQNIKCVVTKEATCTEDGAAVYTCTICRVTVREEILPALNHEIVNGACTHCGKENITVSFNCGPGATITVYKTKTFENVLTENASVTNPRIKGTGDYIDLTGDGQVSFVVDLQPGYELVSVSTEYSGDKPFNKQNIVADVGKENAYNYTKVSGDYTVIIETAKEKLVTAQVASLSLDGDIGVNFKMTLSKAIASSQTTQAIFVYKDVEQEPIFIKDMEPNSQGYYVFTYRIPAKEFANTIGLKFVDNGEIIDMQYSDGIPVSDNLLEYSAQIYCDSLEDESSAKPMIDAMQLYCALVYRVLDTGVDVQPELSDDYDVSAVTAEDLEQYKAVVTGSLTGLTIDVYSLTLETTTEINLKFTLEEGHEIEEYRFQLDSKELVPEKKGRYWVVTIPDIAAKELDTMYQLTVERVSSSEQMKVSCSALSYGYTVLNYDLLGKGWQDTVKALYLYNQAANTYFNK